MSEELQAAAPVDVPQPLGWQQALDDLERSLSEVSNAAARLRRCLAGDDGATGDVAQGLPAKGEAGRSAFDRLWDRIESEQESKGEEPPAEPSEERRGLDLLSQRYLITVEDREGSVDLVPLHRALMGVKGVEEISLVSYANGVPVISVRHQGELEHARVREAIAAATDRECELIDQENGRLFVRLSWPEEREDGDDTTAMGS